MALAASTPNTPASEAQSGRDTTLSGRASSLLWPAEEETNALPIFTLLLWPACLLVGVLGFVLHYDRPRARTVEEPVLAQQLQVELAKDPLPPPDAEPPPLDPLAPPPPPDALAPPAITQPIAVAQPSPAVAFAVPVAGPTRVVDANRAEYATRPAASGPAAPPVKQLILGEGEGNQPKPDYPRRAEHQRQEGTVIVRLTVGEDGRVASAEAVEASPWLLLNEAALKVVRERWRFTVGSARVYEVVIRFTLSK